MSDQDSEQLQLRELLQNLMEFAAPRHSIQQGLLAAIMIADALRAGGCSPDRLKLGITKLRIAKEYAPQQLLDQWLTIVGDCEEVNMPHNFLIVDQYSIDPILAKVHKSHSGLFDGPLPDCYGPVKTTVIYNSKSKTENSGQLSSGNDS